MIAAVWLVLSGLLYSLQLQTGSFPKPLTREEEEHYLKLSAQGDVNARNLRLVAHAHLYKFELHPISLYPAGWFVFPINTVIAGGLPPAISV